MKDNSQQENELLKAEIERLKTENEQLKEESIMVARLVFRYKLLQFYSKNDLLGKYCHKEVHLFQFHESQYYQIVICAPLLLPGLLQFYD